MLLVFVLALAASLLSPIAPAIVHAADTSTCGTSACGLWINPKQVDYNGARFTEKDIANNHMTLTSNTYTGTGCHGAVYDDQMTVGAKDSSVPQPYQTATQATITVYNCNSTGYASSSDSDITLANTFNNLGAFVEWTDSNTMIIPGGDNTAVTNPDGITTVYNDIVFSEKSISNGTMVLVAPGNDPNSCHDETISIGTSTDTYLTALTAQVTTYKLEAGARCAAFTSQFDVLNKYVGVVTTATWSAGWVDPLGEIVLGNVSTADQAYGLKQGDLYAENGLSGANKDNMLLSNSGNSCGNFQMHVQPYQTALTATVTAHFQRGTGFGCDTKDITVALTNGYGGTNNGNPGTTNPTQSDGCPVPADDGWRWFSCPIFGVLNLFTQAMYGLVSNMATIPVGAFFSDKSETVFNDFRDLGLGILAIAGLLMAYNEVIGRDAYRVRKTAPVLFFAAVAIALIWPVAKFGLYLTNDLTFWGGRIFMSIAGTTNSAGLDPGTVIGTFADSTFALIGGVALFGFLGLAGVISLLLSGIIALIFACFVFVARDAILFGLLEASALIIALNALEFSGPKKVAKFCTDAAIVTLMVGPAATALLGITYALSHLFALIGGFGPEITAILIQIFGIGAVILVPRWVGGAIGAVHGLIDGTRGRSVEGALRGFRQRTAGQNWQKFTSGERYLGRLGANRANRIGAGVGAFLNSQDKVGYVFNRDARRSQQTASERQQTAQYAQRPETQATQNNDDMLWAQSYRNAADARRGLIGRNGWDAQRVNRAVQAAMQQGGFGVTRQRYAVDQLAKNGTNYRDMTDMLTTIARVAGNDTQTIGDLIGSTRAASEGAGRLDLKGGFNEMTRITQYIAEHGVTGTVPNDIRREVAQAAMSIDNVTAMRQKPAAIGNFADALTQTADQAQTIAAGGATNPLTGRPYTGAEQIRAAQEAGLYQAQINNMKQAQPYASLNNAQALLERTDNIQVQYNGSVGTLPKMGVPVNDPNNPNNPNPRFFAENTARINAAATQAANAQVANIGTTRTVMTPRGPRTVLPTPTGAMFERARASQYPNNPNNPNPPSDKRLKQHITHLATLANGIKLYSFQYIWGGPTYVGVMAQDILTSHPEALSVDTLGYYHVNYAMLGLRMIRLNEWQAIATQR